MILSYGGNFTSLHLECGDPRCLVPYRANKFYLDLGYTLSQIIRTPDRNNSTH